MIQIITAQRGDLDMLSALVAKAFHDFPMWREPVPQRAATAGTGDHAAGAAQIPAGQNLPGPAGSRWM